MYLGGHSRFALACARFLLFTRYVCSMCGVCAKLAGVLQFTQQQFTHRAGCSQDRLDISLARANAPVTVASSVQEHSTQARPEHSTKARPEHSILLISYWSTRHSSTRAMSIHAPSRAWQQAAASGSMQAGHRHALSRLVRLLYDTTAHMLDRNWRLLQKRTTNFPATDFIENYY